MSLTRFKYIFLDLVNSEDLMAKEEDEGSSENEKRPIEEKEQLIALFETSGSDDPVDAKSTLKQNYENIFENDPLGSTESLEDLVIEEDEVSKLLISDTEER